MRKKAKNNCCRGCDIPWNVIFAEGQCRSCKACLKCCGKDTVYNSCQYRSDRLSYQQKKCSQIGYDAYWRSYEKGNQKR